MLEQTTRGTSQRPHHIRTQLAILKPAFVGMQETRDAEFQKSLGSFWAFLRHLSKGFLGVNSLSTLTPYVSPGANPSLSNIPLFIFRTSYSCRVYR